MTTCTLRPAACQRPPQNLTARALASRRSLRRCAGASTPPTTGNCEIMPTLPSGPRRFVAELARSHARLDALADGERTAGEIELHCGAVDEAEHAAFRLRPSLGLIDPDAVDGGNLAVVDRGEGRDQRRDEDVRPVSSLRQGQRG